MPSRIASLTALALAVCLSLMSTADALTPFEVAQQEVGVSEQTDPKRVVEYLNSVDSTITSPDVP